MLSIPKVGILNLGVGNVGSLSAIITNLSCDTIFVSESRDLLDCNFLIMPGVGAFDNYMKRLGQFGLTDDIKRFSQNSENCLIGICVGMQVLFKSGNENTVCLGLNLIEGEVSKLTQLAEINRVPHVGWETVTFNNELLKENSGDYYFTHSYGANASDYVIAQCENKIVAAVQKNNIFGFQFHPEKSGIMGSSLIKKIIFEKNNYG